VHIRFGLPAKIPGPVRDLIKQADRASAYIEATQLAGFEAEEAQAIFGPPPPDFHAVVLDPLPAAEAQARYVHRFHILAEASGTEAAGESSDAFHTE
jgi:hypothetical protein